MPALQSVLKNLLRERALFQRRISAIMLTIGILALVLIARLAYLQLYQYQLYASLAQKNRLGIALIEPNRGLIFDRKGVLLAGNKLVFNLILTPNQVPNLKKTLIELNQFVRLGKTDLRQFYRNLKLHRRFEPIPLKLKLNEEEVARFLLDRYRFPGIALQTQFVRYYPLGPAFAASVGYVGRIDAKERRTIDLLNYSADSYIGKTGVEKYYERQLRGTVGYQQVETNVHGQKVRLLKQIAPVAGDNLHLTLDSGLQLLAQQVLDRHQGAVVIIDPCNGELLALASNPNFDPNQFVNGIKKQAYQMLRRDPKQPLYNRGLHGYYNPGSIIKPFLSIEALSRGDITPSETLYDPGYFQHHKNGRVYHNDNHRSYGHINLLKALTVSSDVYFYNLGLKMGIQSIYKTLTRFSYGKATGIDLPNEANGLIPNRIWKQRALAQPWYPGDTLNTSIGQGFVLATPLQMAVATATLAMSGQKWWPHILLSRQRADGITLPTQAKLLETLNINNTFWTFIHTAMQNVVTAPNGTAHRYFYDAGYTLAGKTGTAQVVSLKQGKRYDGRTVPNQLRENSLFIAFAPFEKPTIALAVVIQNSTIPAAKIARQLLDYYFDHHNTKL